MQRGPGYKPTYWKEYVREYDEKGMGSEEIAYRLGMSGSEVREYLGRKIDWERERQANEKAAKSAWRRIVEKGENFYQVRDSLKINTFYLHFLLKEEFQKRREESKSFELAEKGEHDYAALVYEESDRCLHDVCWALGVSGRDAKRILDDDYDPYADYHWDEQEALLQKVKSLHESGKSYAQIDWILRNSYVDSKSMLNPKAPSPAEQALQEELEERLSAGEHLDSISRDTGISEGVLLEKLSGKYEHPLDFYGLKSTEREELGRLYLEEGYEADEIAVVMKTDEKSVRYCIREFYYRYSDEDKHDESANRRWSYPDAEKILTPAASLDPEQEELHRKAKSAETAKRCGIDESRGIRFFEDGLLPTRAEIAQSRDARVGIAKAMFDQGKSLEEIAFVTNVSEITVSHYLAEELAAIKEEESKVRTEINREEMANAAYAARAPKSGACAIPGREDCILVIPRLQPRILGYWYAARQCEARRLIAFCGLSIIEAANTMGTRPSKLRAELGSFADHPQSLNELRMHALAIYFYDCLFMEEGEIAEILGLSASDVRKYLNDGRWVPNSPWWRDPWRYGRLSPGQLSEACGIGEGILERASKLGLFGSKDDYPSSYAESLDALKTMGLLDPKPYKFAIFLEECDE